MRDVINVSMKNIEKGDDIESVNVQVMLDGNIAELKASSEGIVQALIDQLNRESDADQKKHFLMILISMQEKIKEHILASAVKVLADIMADVLKPEKRDMN